MPLVAETAPATSHASRRRFPGPVGSLLPRCGNPRCGTGWIRLWRSRRVPVFEGEWACSESCTEAMVARAVRREMDGREESRSSWTHRVPLGLMLVEQGQISAGQLQAAVEGQRKEAAGGDSPRLGEWLLQSGVLSEGALTRVLSSQWNCPVLSFENFAPAAVAGVLPPFLATACEAVPVRAYGGKHLEVAFAGRVDRSLCYALQRMTGMHVVAGIAADSAFRASRRRLFSVEPAPVRHLEAANSWQLVRAMTRWIEGARPVEARLVRIHDTYWLRLWHRAGNGGGLPAAGDVEDLLATLGIGAE